MSISYILLPIRRLWWFITDWDTILTFKWECRHCGEKIVELGKGFLWPIYKPHNRACDGEYMLSWKFKQGWWHCKNCLKVRLLCQYKSYITNRWAFRNEYNWGITK